MNQGHQTDLVYIVDAIAAITELLHSDGINELPILLDGLTELSQLGFLFKRSGGFLAFLGHINYG
jgi:hypothetical protein